MLTERKGGRKEGRKKQKKKKKKKKGKYMSFGSPIQTTTISSLRKSFCKKKIF